MKTCWLPVAFFFGLLVHGRPNGCKSAKVVDLEYARYKGTELGAGVTSWRGMRYAMPPLGDLRWRAPQDPPHKQGVQAADQWRPTCIGLFSNGQVPAPQEDCLFVDVYAPTNATRRSKLPVWFFIQGGGYAGDTDQDFNGTTVVQQSGYDMIFVELSYRVGSFGFLASEKIRRDGELNVGLLDQRKALEWVQRYIHHFGGDPSHVVIHGDSAGAGSIAFHLTAYGGQGKDLFVGGIAESPFFPTHRTVGDSEFQFDRYVSAVNCSDACDSMRCLRGLDTNTLQIGDVVSNYPGVSTEILPQWSWLPVVDGTFSPDLLYNLLEQGRLKRVPLMVGDDTDEGTSFVASQVNSSATFLQYLKANYPKLTEKDLRRISETYPAPGKQFLSHNEWFGPAEEAYGEATLICPGIEMTRSLAQYVSVDKSWNYRFNVNRSTVASAGVYHVSEKPAVFGPGNSHDGNNTSFDHDNKNIVPIVMHYWLSFIQTLNPNTRKYSTAPTWEPWGTIAGGQRLVFETNTTHMEQVPSAQLERCDMWRSMASRTEQ